MKRSTPPRPGELSPQVDQLLAFLELARDGEVLEEVDHAARRAGQGVDGTGLQPQSVGLEQPGFGFLGGEIQRHVVALGGRHQGQLRRVHVLHQKQAGRQAGCTGLAGRAVRGRHVILLFRRVPGDPHLDPVRPAVAAVLDPVNPDR